jgi:hypothetical protein
MQLSKAFSRSSKDNPRQEAAAVAVATRRGLVVAVAAQQSHPLTAGRMVAQEA